MKKLNLLPVETIKKAGQKTLVKLNLAFGRIKGSFSARGRAISRVRVFEGLSGSGKSSTLIKTVNRAREEGREARLFLCSESPVLRERPNITEKGYMACRIPGLICPVDHFVSTEQASFLLDALPPGSLAAFDESFWFGSELASTWVSAARRGVELLIVSPSVEQKVKLAPVAPRYTKFDMLCQRCSSAGATGRFVNPRTDQTFSVCAPCEKETRAEITAELLEMLRKNEPEPGREVIYYPVFLCPEKSWTVLRPDAPRLLELLLDLVRSLDLVDMNNPVELRRRPSYLDLGCNTGYFCRELAERNFKATGIDNSPHNIAIATMLDNYFAKAGSDYRVLAPYNYLRKNREEKADLVTALSVLQRIIINDSVEDGCRWLKWLCESTGRLLLLEMGYAGETHYRGRLPGAIDRDWVYRQIEDSGAFERIIHFEAGAHGLKRDLFAAICPSNRGGGKP